MNTATLLTTALLLSLSTATAHAPNDADDMAKARAAMKKGAGGQSNLFLMADRFKYRAGDTDTALWDAQGWYGTDLRKLWIKTEGNFYLDTEEVGEADVEILYSRAISPFFDLQAGLRQDLGSGPQRTWGVLGFQGLAPWWFEVDAALYVNGEGEVTTSFEAEYEVLLTQRLVLQPRF